MASPGALAVGFGRVVPTAVLGQPLDVRVPIRLEQGERMYAECVLASVMAGDTLLTSSQVRVTVQPTANPAEWIVHVGTRSPVTEPVVEIEVSAGCERRFVRRFTALADPPLANFAAAPVVDEAATAGSATNPVEEPRAMATRRLPASHAPASNAGPRRRMAAAAPVAAPKPRPIVKAPPEPAPRAAGEVSKDAQVARLLLDVSGPHLKMDIEDPVFMPPAARGGASGALDGLASDTERLQVLEKTLSDLQRQSQTYRNNESGLRSQLAEAQTRGRWVPWLLGLLLLSGGAAVWLALRLRGSGTPVAEPQADVHGSPASGTDSRWWEASAALPPAEPPHASKVVPRGKAADEPVPPLAAVTAVPEDDGTAMVTDADEVPSDTYPLPIHQHTQPMPGPHLLPAAEAPAFASIVDGKGPVREVSVEELLDLEQQADFFIALGQEDAAVDLLMSHLRSTGGQSPLPYTKLLEIYQRQGDRSAYERIRARFNRRFNAYAPDWEQGPLHGRHLEDYPEVVGRLQALWGSPIDAMAVLEAMLFRTDERQELFDLPAYKDVLLLYSLARDLYQQQGLASTDVDLLLPLGDDQAFPAITEPRADKGGHDGYDLTAFSLDIPKAPPHAEDDPLTRR